MKLKIPSFIANFIRDMIAMNPDMYHNWIVKDGVKNQLGRIVAEGTEDYISLDSVFSYFKGVNKHLEIAHMWKRPMYVVIKDGEEMVVYTNGPVLNGGIYTYSGMYKVRWDTPVLNDFPYLDYSKSEDRREYLRKYLEEQLGTSVYFRTSLE